MFAVRHPQTNIQLYEELANLPAADRHRVRAGYELAAKLFAGRFRGNGKPFVAHLVGTAAVLARHDTPLDVVLAGLLHAAYEQGNRSRRKTKKLLREAIGPEVEDLVARYSTYDWSRVPDRIEDGDRPIVLMRIANEVDECVDRGLLYAGPKKRREVADGLEGLATAARALGVPRLADEFETVFASNNDDPPEGYASERDWSFRP